jgi:hypothetical protein
VIELNSTDSGYSQIAACSERGNVNLQFHLKRRNIKFSERTLLHEEAELHFLMHSSCVPNMDRPKKIHIYAQNRESFIKAVKMSGA